MIFPERLAKVSTIILFLMVGFTLQQEATAQKVAKDTAQEATVGLELTAEGFTSPVALATPDDGSGRLFIVDQTGLIHIVNSDDKLLGEPFLDLREKIVKLKKEHEERGLLGLAFHPQYQENGRFFVYYSAPLRKEAPKGWDNTSHISEFIVSKKDPNRANSNSEKILLHVDQPQDNHNAGTLAFGSDDYLYISLGDGGGADDKDMGHVSDWYDQNEGGNGQDITENLLGSILRIDVDNGDPYSIPKDNPFLEQDGKDEIYAYGLRNPYRFSFDMEGDQMMIAGDAGQELWEEVNVIEKGKNYGWNVKEATHCFNAANNKKPLDSCPDSDSLGNTLTDPVIEFKTGNKSKGGQGLVVIGGYIYRGEDIPELDGRYVFGTWTQEHEQPQGAIFVADRSDEDLWKFNTLRIQHGDTAGLGHFLLSFGQDRDGELYLLTTDKVGPTGQTGRVYKLTSGELKSDQD